MTKRKKKTPKKKAAVKKAEAPSGDKPVNCPICGATVSPYNLSRNPEGEIVGCMNCPAD